MFIECSFNLFYCSVTSFFIFLCLKIFLSSLMSFCYLFHSVVFFLYFVFCFLFFVFCFSNKQSKNYQEQGVRYTWGYNSTYLFLELQGTKCFLTVSNVFLSWSHSVLTSGLDLEIRSRSTNLETRLFSYLLSLVCQHTEQGYKKKLFRELINLGLGTSANLIFVFFLFIVQWLHSSFPHPFLLQLFNQPFSSILSCDCFQCLWCYLLHKMLTIIFCQMFLESKQKDEQRLQQTAETSTVWDFFCIFYFINGNKSIQNHSMTARDDKQWTNQPCST